MKISHLRFWALALALGLTTAACVTDFEPDPGSCTGGEQMCGTSCYDLQTSEEHCGTCAIGCVTGESCNGGICQPEGCTGGETDCSGICVNLQSDHDHCGTCETVCNSDEVCSEGGCSSECPDTLTNCSGSCVDLFNDEDHCGDCLTSCGPSETCTDGDCIPVSTCPGGQEDCGGECVDLMVHQQNCGSCGIACNDDEYCLDGDCVCNDGLGMCDGACQADGDGDGVGDDCDECPFDNPDDSDLDGVCDSEDVCPGMRDVIQILNGGFESDADWTMSDGALIDGSASGAIEPGEAFISGEAICAGGAVAQAVCIPGDFGRVGALLLSFYHRMDYCVDYMMCEGAAGVTFNGHWNQAGVSWGTEYSDPTFMCLGEAAYGGIMSLALTGRGSDYAGGCNADYTMPRAYDNVSIVPAPVNTCPAPGEVLNGDFSLDLEGWTGYGNYQIETTGSPVNKLMLLVGATGTCNGTTVYGKISQPLLTTLPNQALQLRWQATSGWNATVALSRGTNPLSHSLTGTGSWRTDTICLDPANAGVVQEITLGLPFPGGTCASQPYRYVRFDDLQIVSAPGLCP